MVISIVININFVIKNEVESKFCVVNSTLLFLTGVKTQGNGDSYVLINMAGHM